MNQYVKAGAAQTEERDFNYEDLEKLLIDMNLLDGNEALKGEATSKVENPDDSKERQLIYTRDEEYFTSKVFNLTKGRLSAERSTKTDDMKNNAEVKVTSYPRDEAEEVYAKPDEAEFYFEEEESVYDQEVKVGREFPAPLLFKLVQLANLKENVKDWCERAPDW